MERKRRKSNIINNVRETDRFAFMYQIQHLISKLLLFLIVTAQLFDFIFTSISIQDFLGTGQTFAWSLREANAFLFKARSPAMTFCYDNEKYHHDDAMTKYGYRMVNQMGGNIDNYLWGSIGFFDNSRHKSMDMCNYFKGYYLDVNTERARFMSTKEKLTLVKPLSLHVPEKTQFVGYKNADIHQLDDWLKDGYVGTRRAVEIRMTARMDFNNGPGKFVKHVKSIRSYVKTFCDACEPIAEVGQMFCTLQATVTKGKNDSVVNVNITKSHRRDHSYHRLGVVFPTSSAAFVETGLRIIVLLYVAHCMLNILTTAIKSDEERFFIFKQQGADAATLMSTKVTRPYFSELISPEHNIARASPFSLGFVMYNSDIIVFINVCVVLLTFMTSMQLKHELLFWAHNHETFRAVITRIGLNAKMLWIYLALIKLYKHVAIKMRFHNLSVRMTFDSHLFIWFWLIYLVLLSAVGLDFLLDILFHDRLDIINNFMVLNDISVQFHNGFYFIRIPAIICHSFIVSFLGLVILMILQEATKESMPNNSLFRTFACCHSTVIYDSNLLKPDPSGTAIIIPISTLMNLKWFLKCHCITSPSVDVYEASRGNNTKITIKSERRDNEGNEIPNFTYSILVGGDGGLHIKTRETRKDLEQTFNYRKWLQLDIKLIVV